MSSTQQDKCCNCKGQFDESNFPRLMPSCDHSICTNCLKTLFKNGSQIILCQFCGNEEEILEPDLEYFPKNINLIKLLKDNSLKKPLSNPQLNTPTKPLQSSTIQSSTSISSAKKSQSNFVPSSDSSLISQKSASTQQSGQKFICPTHNKETEIICLRDFTRLCPLCAVFGTHKQHQLKTIDETSQMLSENLKQFDQVKQKKKALDSRIKNPQFKSQLIEKIASTKSNLLKQIKEKFTAIKEAVATAQKNANDDLNRRFKQVNDKINKMVKEESEFESFFSNWARTIDLYLAETNRIGLTFEQKARIFFNGPMKSMQEGQFYLAHIQSYMHEKKNRLEAIPSQVVIQTSQHLIKDIYNFLNVKFEDTLPIGYHDDLLVSSRIQTTMTHTFDGKGNFGQESNYMSQNFSVHGHGHQAPGVKISSAKFIQEQNIQSTMGKKPIKVEFSSSQNFLSPNNKDRFKSPSNNGLPPRKSPRQKSKSLPKPTSTTNLMKSRISPQKKQLPTPQKTSQLTESRKRYLESSTQGIVELFMSDDKLDTLDLCAFDMPDNQIVLLLDYVNNKKRVKCLKLSQNKLTNDGFVQIVPYLKFTTNLNLSSNLLTEDVLNTLIKHREKVPNLRILNLAHNKVNQRKAKVYVDQLKKQGIIVTLS